jgi:lysophospholipase L1-like esterase
MQSIARMRIAAHRATRLLAPGAVAVAALALASARPIAKDGFALRDGDRVVFYGDSITEARHYTTFVETYVVTRFPRLDATFVHSGWGGDGVNGGHGGDIDTRLARDVLAYEPTVLTIMLGMNDATSWTASEEADPACASRSSGRRRTTTSRARRTSRAAITRFSSGTDSSSRTWPIKKGSSSPI